MAEGVRKTISDIAPVCLRSGSSHCLAINEPCFKAPPFSTQARLVMLGSIILDSSLLTSPVAFHVVIHPRAILNDDWAFWISHLRVNRCGISGFGWPRWHCSVGPHQFPWLVLRSLTVCMITRACQLLLFIRQENVRPRILSPAFCSNIPPFGIGKLSCLSHAPLLPGGPPCCCCRCTCNTSLHSHVFVISFVPCRV